MAQVIRNMATLVDYASFTAALAAAAPGDELRYMNSDALAESTIIGQSVRISFAAGAVPALTGVGAGSYVWRVSAAVQNVTITGNAAGYPIVASAAAGAGCIRLDGNNDGFDARYLQVQGTTTQRGFYITTQPGTVLARDIALGTLGDGFYLHGGCSDTQIDRVVSLPGTECDNAAILCNNDWGGHAYDCLFRTRLYGVVDSAFQASVHTLDNVLLIQSGGTKGFVIGVNGSVYHCRAAGLAGVGLGFECGDPASVLLVDSVVTGYSEGVRSAGAWSPTYCNVWDNTTNYAGAAVAGVGCISVDPLDIGGGDYQPQPGSPVIDAGSVAGIGHDLNGNPRPSGAAPDMGPYEAQQPAVILLSPSDELSSWVDFSSNIDQGDAATTDPANYPLTSLGAGVAAVVASVDVFPLIPASVLLHHNELTGGEQYRVTVNPLVKGTSGYGVDPGANTADMTAIAVAPQVTLAEWVDETTVRVTFDEAVYGADLTDATAWALTALDGLSDAEIVSVVAGPGNTTAILTVVPMTPGGLYRATAPATLEDAAHNAIDPAHLSADFAAEGWGDAPDEEGILEAFTSAFGEAMAYLLDAPATRLRAPLAPGATTMLVESTLNLPASGTVYCEGERIAYAGKTGDTLTGLTRETVNDPADGVDKVFRFEDYPVGAGVRDASRLYSLRDQARNDTWVRRSSGEMLDALARERGYPRPLGDMTDADTQSYVCTRYYLAAGTWLAVYRVLRAMLAWADRTGTDGVAIDASTLECASLPFSGRLHDRWIIVDDRLYRVRKAEEVAGVTRLSLYAFDAPFFGAAALTPAATGLSWRLLSFRLGIRRVSARSLLKAAHLVIHIYPGSDGLPVTYVGEAPVLTPVDGRAIGGQVLTDTTVPGYTAPTLYHPLYLLNPYADEVAAVVQDIVPAGVFVEVFSLPR